MTQVVSDYGNPVTTHGAIHAIVSQIVFVTWPLGMLLISFAYGRKEFFPSPFALVVAGAISASNQVLALNINGLSEHIFIAVLLAWSQLTSFDAYQCARSNWQRRVSEAALLRRAMSARLKELVSGLRGRRGLVRYALRTFMPLEPGSPTAAPTSLSPDTSANLQSYKMPLGLKLKKART
ncbi:MAG TPA: hypothetical protein VNA15_10100 [Candidatus Angelobacter sp.]|nr:hypothetical protein [Candidatus Angelobacter sp.]